jgi:hypothetical protein
VDAVELAKDLLTTSTTNSVIIYTADHQIIPWCLTTDRHDNAAACKAVCELISTILFDHPGTTISVRWIPGSTSFLLLKHLLEVATASAAASDPTEPQAPATIAALKQKAKLDALKVWEKVWLADPRHNPAYRALHHPPSGQPPDFISGIKSFARPIFCTAIRLLTEHAFTGEYNARHCPRAPDPHGCQCRQAPLQTADHIITACPLFDEAQEEFLRPAAPTLSTSIIFGTKAGGRALAQFIEATQACVRPRCRPVEDHS